VLQRYNIKRSQYLQSAVVHTLGQQQIHMYLMGQLLFSGVHTSINNMTLGEHAGKHIILPLLGSSSIALPHGIWSV
jgi:hypothetical protein